MGALELLFFGMVIISMCLGAVFGAASFFFGLGGTLIVLGLIKLLFSL